MEKLAEVGIAKSDQEANLQILQSFWSDYSIDKTLLQYTLNLTLTHIEDRVRTTHREVEEIRKAIDRSVHVLIAADGPRHFPQPDHHQGN